MTKCKEGFLRQSGWVGGSVWRLLGVVCVVRYAICLQSHIWDWFTVSWPRGEPTKLSEWEIEIGAGEVECWPPGLDPDPQVVLRYPVKININHVHNSWIGLNLYGYYHRRGLRTNQITVLVLCNNSFLFRRNREDMTPCCVSVFPKSPPQKTKRKCLSKKCFTAVIFVNAFKAKCAKCVVRNKVWYLILVALSLLDRLWSWITSLLNYQDPILVPAESWITSVLPKDSPFTALLF